MAVSVYRVGSSYTMKVNGRQVAQVGVPGRTAEETRHAVKPIVVQLPESSDIEIEFHVANYVAVTAGLISLIRVGTITQIAARRQLVISWEIFFLGAVFFVSWFNFAIYFGRKDQRGYLYVALLAIVGIAFIGVSGSLYLPSEILRLGYNARLRIDYSSFGLLYAILLLFLRATYPHEFHRVSVWIATATALAYAIFVWIAPPQLVATSVIVPQGMWLLVMGYSFVTLIRCLRHKRDGIGIFAAGAAPFMAAFGYEFYLIVVAHRFEGMRWTPLGSLMLFVALTALLSRRFSQAYRRTVSLAQELTETNAAYATFVPMQFLTHLKKNKITDIVLGDQTREEMGILFADIRSFTTLSEGFTEDETFQFINDFFAEMEPCIRKHGGFIDKYLGDGVMALFSNSAIDGIDAALAMRRQLNHFNERKSASLDRPTKVGWGVHFGPLMLGIIGASERMESTVLSDAVNVAARLEKLTKTYENDILVSESLMVRATDRPDLCARYVDYVQVKGRTKPERVYEVLDRDIGPDHQAKIASLELFQQGINRFYSREFQTAETTFEKIVASNPSDRVARIFLARSRTLTNRGVPEDWDGVFVAPQ